MTDPAWMSLVFNFVLVTIGQIETCFICSDIGYH